MSWVDGEPDPEEVRASLDELFGQMKGVEPNTRKPARRKRLDHQRKGKKGRRSPVIDYVRSLGDYYVTSEVAEKIGMSDQWVRKAAEKRWTQAPSYVAPFGQTHVNLYTKEDIKALKDFIKNHRTVFTREEFENKEG